MKAMAFALFISIFYGIGLGVLGYGLVSAKRSIIAAG